MAGHKQSRAKPMASSQKENLPPARANRTISVSGLFDQKRYASQKGEKSTRNVLAPKPAGVTKWTQSHTGSFSQLSKPKKAQEHPLYQSLADATDEYRKSAARHTAHHLEPVYKALIARVDGLDVQGQPLAMTTTLSTPKMEAPIQCEALSKPLEERTFIIQTRQKNETKQITLGQLMHSFEKVVEQKRAKLEDLFTELRRVEDEMATAYQDVLLTENGVVKEERRQLDKDLAALAKEAYEAKEQTLAEVKQAQEDEQATAADEKRKLSEFFNSL